MADVTFISSLLTTSPYPNIKMFKEGFIPAGYIYTDSGNYKASEDNTFLYCCEQDERDPEGQTTLAIYYDDPGGDPDMDDYTEYANDHPAFYRGRHEFEGDTFDLWDMYEGSVCIMTFLTHIITTDPVVEEPRGTIDLTQYCPIYEDLLKTAFETGSFPSSSYTNTFAQICGPDITTSDVYFAPYTITNPGPILRLTPDFMVFVQGKTNTPKFPKGSLFNYEGWKGKSVLLHPGYVTTSYRMKVDPHIFVTFLQQSDTIQPSDIYLYFAVVDIDAINDDSPDNDFHGVVAIPRPPITIGMHTPSIILWGRTRYNGYNLIVPVAFVAWDGNTSGTITQKILIDWKSYMP